MRNPFSNNYNQQLINDNGKPVYCYTQYFLLNIPSLPLLPSAPHPFSVINRLELSPKQRGN